LVGLLRGGHRRRRPRAQDQAAADPTIDAEVDLNFGDDGYSLRARLNVSLPGLERDIAQALVEGAHQTCPYSKATRGNIDVAITLV
jgi:organic hydroperoxide reductase OsmC/OhrA